MIKDELVKLLQKATKLEEVHMEHPTEASHGDYSTNIALVLAKKEKKSPLALANELVSRMRDVGELREGEVGVEKIEVAPPGFINFWLSEKALLEELEKARDEGYGGVEGGGGKGRTMVIDYSSPNIAKAFGIGHLRSTIIGQAIYNLYKLRGWKAVGDNHLGDWGTQFGILLYQVISKDLDPKTLTIDQLEKLYVDFHKESVDDPDLQEEARAWFKKLEQGDKTARRVWKILKDLSLNEFNRIYDLLGVRLDVSYGESFYEAMLPGIIEECVKKGIARKDNGAVIIEYEGLPPAIIQKSDGATTYLTRDLATIKFRIKEWNPNLIVYEVGSEQELHFKQLFAAVEMLEWSKKVQFVHIKHGLYLSPGGKKFSTRKGETIYLEDILDEAIKRSKDVVKEKPVKGEKLTVAQAEDVAKAVGVGAIKYYDLSHHPTTNIVFDWEDIFALEGNSGPYLQYTFARTQSVLGKAKMGDVGELGGVGEVNSEEEALLRTFYKFPEVINEAAENFSPNLLCNFLYDFATKYNRLYNTHRILEAESEEAKRLRLALTQITGDILKRGLNLLGIEAPEKM